MQKKMFRGYKSGKKPKVSQLLSFFYFDGSHVLVIQINSFIREYDEKGNDEEECH